MNVTELRSQTMSAASSRIDVDMKLDQRLKGLVWYSLYDVDFNGDWTYLHEHEERVAL